MAPHKHDGGVIAVKIQGLLLSLGALLLVAQPSKAASNCPEIEPTLLEQMADQDPAGYEVYRKCHADNAPTLEEFLQWATPQEIAEDAGVDFDADLPVENAGPTLVNVSVNLARRVLVMSTPEGTVSGGALGARKGYRVPTGCFRPLKIVKDYWSQRYDAPMPNSVFITQGVALHAGSLSVGSHGCIHLDNATSLAVYNAVKTYGRANTTICVR